MNPPAGPVVIGASGSLAALRAASAAVRVYGDDASYLVVAAVSGADLLGEANRRVDDIVHALGVPARRIVTVGDPATVLCRVAQDHGASALVIGVTVGADHRRRPVASRVMRDAPCPVFVMGTEPSPNEAVSVGEAE